VIGSYRILFLHLPPPSCAPFTTRHEMTQERKKSGSGTEPVVDEAKIHALRQYNDADGHFSLVRFVDGGSRDHHETRSEVFANESWFRAGISISQTS
jgi:hypothetical protein